MTDPASSTPPKRLRRSKALDRARADLLGVLAARVAAAPKKPKRKAKAAAEKVEAPPSPSLYLFDTRGDRDPDLDPIPTKGCTVKERVDFIVTVMAANRWRLYHTRKQLAEAWGVSDSSIKAHAAEAHRLLHAEDPQEREERRQQLVQTMTELREKAMRERDDRTGLVDGKTIVSATELEAKLLGYDLNGKTTVELSGKNGAPVDLTGGLAGLFAKLAEEESATKTT